MTAIYFIAEYLHEEPQNAEFILKKLQLPLCVRKKLNMNLHTLLRAQYFWALFPMKKCTQIRIWNQLRKLGSQQNSSLSNQSKNILISEQVLNNFAVKIGKSDYQDVTCIAFKLNDELVSTYTSPNIPFTGHLSPQTVLSLCAFRTNRSLDPFLLCSNLNNCKHCNPFLMSLMIL